MALKKTVWAVEFVSSRCKILTYIHRVMFVASCYLGCMNAYALHRSMFTSNDGTEAPIASQVEL